MSYNQVVPLRGRSAAEAVSRYSGRESTHSPLAHSWASARKHMWGLSLRVRLSGTCGIRAHSAAGAARPLDAKSVILYNLAGALVNMTIDSVFPPFAQNQNAISNNRLVFSVAVSTSDCTSIFFIFAIVCAEYAIISDEHLVPLSGTGAI